MDYYLLTACKKITYTTNMVSIVHKYIFKNTFFIWTAENLDFDFHRIGCSLYCFVSFKKHLLVCSGNELQTRA